MSILYVTLITHYQDRNNWLDYLHTHGIPAIAYPRSNQDYHFVQQRWHRSYDIHNVTVTHWDYISYIRLLYSEFGKHFTKKARIGVSFTHICFIHQYAEISKNFQEKHLDSISSTITSCLLLDKEQTHMWDAILFSNMYFSSFLQYCDDDRKSFQRKELQIPVSDANIQFVFFRNRFPFSNEISFIFSEYMAAHFHPTIDDNYHMYTLMTPIESSLSFLWMKRSKYIIEPLPSLSLITNTKKSGNLTPIPPRLYLLCHDSYSICRWKKTYEHKPWIDITSIPHTVISSYIFPEFKSWEFISKHSHAYRIFRFIYLYNYGGCVLTDSTHPLSDIDVTVFNVNMSSKPSLILFVDQFPLQSYNDLYLNILMAEAKSPIVYYFLMFFFSNVNIENVDVYLTDTMIACCLVHTLKYHTKTSSSIIRFVPLKSNRCTYPMLKLQNHWLIYPNTSSIFKSIYFPYLETCKFTDLKTLDIAMLVRSNEHYLETMFWPTMRNIQKTFPYLQFRFFFYENNSEDATVQSILRQRNHFSHIYLFQQDLQPFLKIDRTERIGKIRNIFVREICKQWDEEDCEERRKDIRHSPYILFIDSDIIFFPETIQCLCETMFRYPDAVMIGSNGIARDGIYYDILALNHGIFFKKKCRTEVDLYLKSFSSVSDVCSVNSCFGGMTLVYKDLLYLNRYGDNLSSTLQGIYPTITCEHFEFCRQLKTWGNIYIAFEAHAYWVSDWLTQSQSLIETFELKDRVTSL